jgi:hypothetical protein
MSAAFLNAGATAFAAANWTDTLGFVDDAETLWLYSVSIRRDHPLVAAVGVALNLSSSQIDDVFRTANTI